MTVPALAGRRVVLGVSGGIAAYKAVELCRRLIDAGAFVSPVLTPAATRFVGAVTFSALASEPARTSLYTGPEAIPHTRLGQGADLIVVAPATARVIGAYAAGISSDLLTATLLASRAPVLIAPAMHTEMWEHPAVQDNLATLARRGVHIVEAAEGRLAGGDVGKGRMAEPAEILGAASTVLSQSADLAGLKAVVTAGGTREPLDAVRYLGNRSSGKQGHAIASELTRRGAIVTLVTTSHLPTPAGAERVQVETAEEMRAAVSSRAATDIVVMAAAVADFRPSKVVEGKIKKDGGPPQVVLESTPDILAELGAHPVAGRTLVGFAAETPEACGAADARSGLESFARQKLQRKGADLIVANDVSADQVGFGYETNSVIIVGIEGVVAEVALSSKPQVATAVVDAIVGLRRDR